ncbi:MAG: ROK family protein [Planctomycetota bacterium]|nr:ROK family protein [Planctomycetota bacterium]
MGRILIGIDLGGTNIKGAALRADGRVVRRAKIPTENERGGAPAVLKRMSELAIRIADEAGAGKRDVLAIGVGAPGPLNSRTGVIVETPNLKWKNVHVAREMRRMTGLPVFLENDAIAAAYGEYWKGAGRGAGCMFILTLGTGVGGGIILNGEPLKGIDDTASHLGHIPVELEGRLCSCGSVGCLEAYASATGIVARTLDRLAAGGHPDSPLRQIPSDRLTAADVSAAAKAGCPLARSVIEETGAILGVAIAGLANALNPEICVIGGGVSAMGRMLFGPIRRTVRARALRIPARRIRIVPAALGDDMGCVGAAGLALLRLRKGGD